MAGHERLSIGFIRVFIALWNWAFIRLHGHALGNLAIMLANNSNDALRSSAHPMALTPKGDLKPFEFNITIKPGAGRTIVGAFFKDAGN